jgi:hypothetical protein
MLPYPLDSAVSVWQHVDVYFRLFAFVLVIVAMVSFVGALQTWVALRRVRRAGGTDNASVQAVLSKLERGCAFRAARLQLMFYLFAVATSWALVNSYHYASILSKTPTGFYVLADMGAVFVFAYWCSLVFVVVHVLQWIIASRVAAASRAAQSIAS